MRRSCQASAYGQWLQVKITAVGRPSASACSLPSVAGRERAGASSPMLSGMDCLLEGVADVVGVGRGGVAAVAQPVDAARERRGLVGDRLDVAAVDADRRRADERLALGVRVGRDLAQLDLRGVEADLGHGVAQLGERPLRRGAPLPPQKFDLHRPYGRTTAAPSKRPWRRSSSASFARSSGYVVTDVLTGTCGAISSSSRPSCRVRLATLRTTRSPHRSSYGKDGMSLMWIPPHTTTPPFA